MHLLDVCLDDQSAKFIFASFLMEDVFRKKKTQARSPTHAQANRFIQLAFLASCPNLLLIKNRENYEQSVSFIT